MQKIQPVAYFTCSRARSQVLLTTSTQETKELVLAKDRLLAKGLDLAKDRLLALPQEESEKYTGSRELVLRENVSLDAYLKYRERDPDLSVLIYLDNGTIKAYELPTFPHSRVSATIKVSMGAWNRADLVYGDDVTLILGANSSKEPDSWVRPKYRIRPGPGAPAANNLGAAYPTMIIEVGHSQSLLDLHRKVALYFSPRTTIQIVLLVKIFKPKGNNTITLIVAKYVRTSQTPLIPKQVISFGTATPHQSTINYITNTMGVPQNCFIGFGRRDPVTGNNYPACNMANIGLYLMNIPANELFDGDSTVRPFTQAINQGFNLDLYEIQEAIRNEFNI
ncbi:uncharacterized protein OCT59_027702 [Rhizophagus irregularis]|uniref:Putative restriction endonuclease domain-containing protein n=1 Tax=Rhizophagus irregularis (strain DAOM 181602 / DAOM 197198 / MUCL 43194) TaxID=747089 RepID=U9UE09_RHIID|nr:hypothetical protein OCT59_027702 [Rhizophagus irregularis]GBC15737.1 hypothetical protein GLOIN_2v1791074 [Rhizophagus irregularis DAOM 181602=DAOM 197198]